MGIDSETTLADFGMQLVRRTRLTFVQAAKFTFGTMLASAMLFATISLVQKYPSEMGLILLAASCIYGAVYFAKWLSANKRRADWHMAEYSMTARVETSEPGLATGRVRYTREKILANHPELESVRSQFILARIASDRGQYAAALNILRSMLASDRTSVTLSGPEIMAARYLMAQLLSKLGRHAEAVTMLEKLLADVGTKKTAVDVDPAYVAAIPQLEREVLAAIEQSILRREKDLPTR